MRTNAEITDMIQIASRWDDGGNCHHGIEVGFDTRTGDVISGPPPRPLGRIDVELRGDTIWALGYQP